MKKNGPAFGSLSKLFFVLFLFSLVGMSYAQLEGLEKFGVKEDTVKCIPDSLTTPYDKFKSDSIGQQQLGIWYSLAREEYKYKNYQRAIPYYWKILENDTTGRFKVVYAKLAESYYSLNEPDSVFIVVYRGLEKYPDYSTLHYWAGFVHDVLGQTKCAIPQYEALVKENPQEKSYWEKLAYLYYKENDPKAIQAQQKVVELEPGNVEASRLLAEIMTHFGEDPLKALEQTYLNDTTNVDNAMRYAKAAFERGLYEKSLKVFKQIVKLEPKNTTAMEYIGRDYESLNQLQSALRSYKEILQIEPKNAKVMSLIASIYGRLNEFVTARSYVDKAIRVAPGDGLPYMIMGEVYENAVTYCQNKRTKDKFTYDDKLVYRLAQEEYKKAAKDPNYESDAKRRVTQLEPLLPTKEDLFMQKNRLTPKDPCYSWINK
ncbi:MAG: hypothetical protein P8184_03985 [Calditrichia bacterium]